MIKNVLLRIKIDWREYWDAKREEWFLRRDQKFIRRALRVATVNNEFDKRTYRILRDATGCPGAYHSLEWKWLMRTGQMAKMNHVELDKHTIAIISTNKETKQQEVEWKKKKG